MKARTVRLYWGLLIGGLLLVALFTVLSAVLAGQQGTDDLSSDSAVGNVWSSASGINILTLVAGILLMTGEFRHQTVTTTFLAAPHRSTVVVGKIVAGALLGLFYGVMACAMTAAVALPILAVRDATGSAPVAKILLGCLLVSVCYAVIGVGVGALVRNQVAAVVGALVWVFVVEGLLGLIPWVREDAGQFLPGGAAAALSNQVGNGAPDNVLSMWAAALVLIGYGVVMAAFGAMTTVRRDVT